MFGRLVKVGSKWVLLTAFILLATAGLSFLSIIRPAKILSETTPSDLGLYYQPVSFETRDGLFLSGWFVPKQSNGLALDDIDTTIVVMHGYPADKGNVLSATYFLAQDHNLLFFDFRYLGESEGSYSTVGALEVLDLQAAIDFLKDDHDQRIFGLWGFSLGGSVALQEASKHSEVKAVVSISSYANLSDMALEALRWPVLRYPLSYLIGLYSWLWFGVDIDRVDPARAISGYEGPVLVIHSLDDEVISFSHGQKIFSALSENDRAQLWVLSGPHGSFFDFNYEQKIRDFFNQNL